MLVVSQLSSSAVAKTAKIVNTEQFKSTYSGFKLANDRW